MLGEFVTIERVAESLGELRHSGCVPLRWRVVCALHFGERLVLGLGRVILGLEKLLIGGEHLVLLDRPYWWICEIFGCFC